MNFFTKLFNLKGSSSKSKPKLKLTPEVLAAKARIEARKEKEEKALEAQVRRARLTGGLQFKEHTTNNQHSATIQEEIRRLEKKSVRSHSGRLVANSEIMGNSKLDLWYNTILPEDPPETIAPDMLIPESFSENKSETDKMEIRVCAITIAN